MNHKIRIVILVLLCTGSQFLLATSPDQPVISSPENAQGEIYNDRPFLIVNVSDPDGDMINDMQIQWDDDSGFGTPLINVWVGLDANWNVRLNPWPAVGSGGGTDVRLRNYSGAGPLTYNTTWYLRIRVKDDSNALASNRNSEWSATKTVYIKSPSWTDASISTGTTLIRATHFNEIQNNIDSLRAFRGSGNYAWSSSPIAAAGSIIKKSQLDELRTAVTAPFNEATGSNPVFADSTITAGTTLIRTKHIIQLRKRIETLD